MELTVEPGRTYAVTTSGSCTVTDADGMELCTAAAGAQAFFVATSGTVSVSDDTAKVVKATFNCALAGRSSAGEGSNVLPVGYTRVAFLLTTGQQYVRTGFYPTSQSGVEMDFCVMEETSASFWPFGNGDTGRNDEPDKKFSLLYTHDRTYPRGIFYLGEALTESQIFALAGTRQLLKVANGIVSAGRGSMSAPTANFVGITELTICSHVRQGNAMKVRWYGCKLTENGSLVRNFVPSIDAEGEPCFYDPLSRKTCRNERGGAFVVGVESLTSLATLLSKLPVANKSMQLLLPSELQVPALDDMLAEAQAEKGWTLSVYDWYTADASAASVATYSLRRVRSVVWCRREQAEYGGYVAEDASRWQIDRCVAIYGALGNDPTAYGYEPFDGVEQAAEVWGLVPYVEPDMEAIAD